MGAKPGAKCYASGMADTRRRGYGEDGIYFDHAGECRDSRYHKGCDGRWRGVISLGFSADGKRRRKKVASKIRCKSTTGVGSLQDRQVFEGRTHARACPSIAY